MKQYNRRNFLKTSGAVAATTALAACGGKNENNELNLDPMGNHTTPVPTDKMTYRTNPKNGDRVSILGYGWMRLPTKKANPDDPNGDVIDQEEVNRLCKYALDHGVNYFDTSPAYCRVWRACSPPTRTPTSTSRTPSARGRGRRAWRG